MKRFDPAGPALPDVANGQHASAQPALAWVGMRGVELPIVLADAEGAALRVAARLDALVDLGAGADRGIHMSRLYLMAERELAGQALSVGGLRRVLRGFLESHTDLSSRARLRLRFDYLLRRPALVSGHSGWRSYPIELTATLARGHCQIELGFAVLYSSTCPASAALSRAAIAEQFGTDFADQPAPAPAAVQAWLASPAGMVATPHAQRSRVEVRLRLLPSFDRLPIVESIDRVEAALGTAVQTAVKREDEQAFARLNASNLMFCEDAARRVHQALDEDPQVSDFWLCASHYESLHPHDAVAVACKGVPGGYDGNGSAA
ncbi:MAG: GTP cyclohydrolase FolE2 [Lysobacterales bacterium]